MARLAKFEADEDVRALSPQVLSLYEQVLSIAWGFGVKAFDVHPRSPMPLPPGPVAEGAESDSEADSSSYSSSLSPSASPPPSTPKPATSSSTEDRAPEAPLRWILPTRTAAKLHLKLGIVDNRGRVIPPCRSKPYVFGYREGEGLAGSRATGAKWCTECARLARQGGHDLEAEL